MAVEKKLLFIFAGPSRMLGAREHLMTEARHIFHSRIHQLMEDSAGRGSTSLVLQTRACEDARWQPPPGDTLRVDVDGSVDASGNAACGGVMRDSLRN